jgi:iron complex transport system substrate-binding protein
MLFSKKLITKLILCLYLISILVSCNVGTKSTRLNNNNSSLTYAKRFTITKEENATVLELLGNKGDSAVTATFVLYSKIKPTNHQVAYFIKTPVNRVACMSSIYTTMLAKLGKEKSIIAIDNIDYYNNAFIQQAVNEHKITELSKGPKINLEQTIALNPDLILTYGMGNPSLDVDKKLLQANIPIAISLDHLEETPLARAEWIKFFACFFNKEQLADSLFAITEKKYLDLKKLTKHQAVKPTILTEIKYGDTWYVPAGNSYIANLLSDAGAIYFWSNEKQTGSIPLPFETVYTKAKDCDFWINLYQVNTKKELLSYDERYSLFNAFNKNKLYNNNKIQNSKGFSNYWESGISNPDEVLADLISIISPSLLPNHTLIYYKQIE